VYVLRWERRVIVKHRVLLTLDILVRLVMLVSLLAIVRSNDRPTRFLVAVVTVVLFEVS
jgi:hypothetical protein